MKLKAFCVFIAALILTAAFPAATASAYTIAGFEIESQAVLFASLDTGSILYQKNADERRYPASLTKLMTAAVVMDNCPDIDVEIEVPDYCLELLSGTGSTVGGLLAGEHISVRSLLEMLLISSAADAANTLADYINGEFYALETDTQRPAGVYFYDSRPVNTILIAITRGGKGFPKKVCPTCWVTSKPSIFSATENLMSLIPKQWEETSCWDIFVRVWKLETNQRLVIGLNPT